MTTQTLTLTDFLLARISEDEAEARGEQSRYLDAHGAVGFADAEYAFAFMNPARVLAECEAKRRIVEIHSGSIYCEMCGDMQYVAPCPTLRALAAIYADHEDWREEWRP